MAIMGRKKQMIANMISGKRMKESKELSERRKKEDKPISEEEHQKRIRRLKEAGVLK